MKIQFRPKFIHKVISGEGSYQVEHEDLIMTVLKGEDILSLTRAAFVNRKHGWYSHLYSSTRCYTGMSGNGLGVLNRTRKHLDPRNIVEYKDGIETVIVLTCKHRDLSTDVLYALEHTFTQLSTFASHREGVRNSTGTHFNLKNEDEVYDWARSYAVYLTMFKNQGYTHYNVSPPFIPIPTGAKMFKLTDANVVIENYDGKKLRILEGSRFPVPGNVIIEHCTYMGMFNELVKSNIVTPIYNEKDSSIELVFMKDYNINKRFNLDELTSLFQDEMINDAVDKWKNNTTSLKTYLNGNNNKRVTKR